MVEVASRHVTAPAGSCSKARAGIHPCSPGGSGPPESMKGSRYDTRLAPNRTTGRPCPPPKVSPEHRTGEGPAQSPGPAPVVAPQPAPSAEDRPGEGRQEGHHPVRLQSRVLPRADAQGMARDGGTGRGATVPPGEGQDGQRHPAPRQGRGSPREAAAEAAGLDPSRLSGHSLRSGLATAAAKARKSERSIMAQTGHRSAQMVRRYIRDGELFSENAAAGLL